MPKNLASMDFWKNLEKEINDRFEMNAAVFDSRGARITDFANWGNKLCPVIKGNPASLSAICAVANKAFLNRAKSDGHKPIVDCCDAGLLKLCVPIRVNGTFLGFAGGCGCLPEQGDLESFFISKTTGVPESEVNDLKKTVPVMSDARIRETLDFIAERLSGIQKG